MWNSIPTARIAAVARVVVLSAAVTLLTGCGGGTQSSQPSYSSGSSVKQHLDAGMAAWNNGNKQAAVGCYSQAITIDPRCKKAYLARGQLYNELGQHHDAFNDFHEAIELDPNDSYAYDERAKIYRLHGIEDKAQRDENKAAELRGQDFDGLRERINEHRGTR